MINHVTLQGNLTRDPEIRFTTGGTAVCEITIAHNKKWKTEAGESKEVVAFIAATIWGKKGEAFAQYHRKGDQALITGELAQENWDDKKSGEKRSKTKVNVLDWHFVGGQKTQQQGATPSPRRNAAPSTASPAGAAADDGGDQVPF